LSEVRGNPKGAKARWKASRLAARIGSLPLSTELTCERSTSASSSAASAVRSKAKFGAAVTAPGCSASSRIQRSGSRTNSIGVKNTERAPRNTGVPMSRTRPMSWKNGTQPARWVEASAW